MVAIRNASECDCESCEGSHSTPGRFGGWVCNCQCHQFAGDTKKEFIKVKNGGDPFEFIKFIDTAVKNAKEKHEKRKKTELDKCPCCKGIAQLHRSEHAFVGQVYSDRYPDPVARQDHGFYVRCLKCGLQTCFWHYDKEALDAWNKRAV